MIYSIGATGSIHALYDIVYQNIIIDKCVNDTAQVLRDGLNKNIVQGTLVGIKTLLQEHDVCVLYILLPSDAYDRNPIITDIYRGFCSNFDLNYLDIEDEYKHILDITTDDNIYFKPEYQKNIASRIIDFIDGRHYKKKDYILPALKFKIFNPMLQGHEVTLTQFKTALRTSLTTMVTNGMQFDIPSDMFPVACAFWNKTGMTVPNLYYTTPSGVSEISVNWHWDGFCVRAIAETNMNDTILSWGAIVAAYSPNNVRRDNSPMLCQRRCGGQVPSILKIFFFTINHYHAMLVKAVLHRSHFLYTTNNSNRDEHDG